MLTFIKSIYSIISKKDTSLIIRMSVILVIISFIEFFGLAMISFLIINIGSMDTLVSRFPVLNSLGVDQDLLPLVLSLFVCAYALFSISISILFLKFVSINSQLIAGRIKLKLIDYYLSLGWLDHIQNSSAEKISRIQNDATYVGQQILFAMHLFSRFALALIITAALLFYNLAVTGIMVISLTLSYFVIFKYFKPRISKNSSIVAQERDLALRTLTNMFGSIKEIIFYNSRSRVLSSFDEMNIKVASSEGINMYLAQIPRFIIDSLLLIALVLFAAFYSTQEISTNSFLMNISIYGVAGLKLLPAFQNIFYFASEIQARSKYLNNITPLINKITTQESSKLSENNFTFEKLVEFSNVSFSYETGLKEAIRDLNIKIEAGKKIAIIGPSGSGKSTFIDILLGFINPGIGEITIDAKSLKKLNQIKYRENFAYVPQKLFLLEASLRENIIFGSRESTNHKDRLNSALSASKANSFIDHLSNGIDTLVSDSNLSLSGGQKQTIGIARAMYHGGKILVLDEATSAMDSGLEEKIMDEIAQSSFKTVIAITHKPSMLKYFDKIYIFNEGTIEAHGTYEDLKSTNKFLSEMIDVSKRGVN
jgi:ABC-type bacteriocin/lantibiotic exporter with double-glycine peptidase domain